MASLFGSLFGWAEKKTEEPFQPVPPKTQQYDREYIDYCVEPEHGLRERHLEKEPKMRYDCHAGDLMEMRMILDLRGDPAVGQ